MKKFTDIQYISKSAWQKKSKRELADTIKFLEDLLHKSHDAGHMPIMGNYRIQEMYSMCNNERQLGFVQGYSVGVGRASKIIYNNGITEASKENEDYVKSIFNN